MFTQLARNASRAQILLARGDWATIIFKHEFQSLWISLSPNLSANLFISENITFSVPLLISPGIIS